MMCTVKLLRSQSFSLRNLNVHTNNFLGALIFSGNPSSLLSSARLISTGSVSSSTTPVSLLEDLSKCKVIFIGSDNFSIPSLVELSKLLSPQNVSVVVSSEKNIVSKYAVKQGNKIYHWKDFKSNEFIEASKNKFPYLFGVVASFGYLIPERVINRFPLGILNVHASLLPRWRGASPINHCIIFGDTETGISIMKIAPHRFDVGPVLLKRGIPLDDHIRATSLLPILADLGAKTLLQVVQNLSHYLRHPQCQDDSLATCAPKLTPEMAEVDWNSKTASEIYRLFRGLHGTFKLRTTFNERKVDLDEIQLPLLISQFSDNCNNSNDLDPLCPNILFKELKSEGSPGEIVFTKNNLLCVRCAQSSGVSTWIVVKKVKIGIKWMSALDFRNGFLSKGKLTSGSRPRFYLSKSVIEDKHCMRNL